jgi:hypothetical protein
MLQHLAMLRGALFNSSTSGDVERGII